MRTSRVERLAQREAEEEQILTDVNAAVGERMHVIGHYKGGRLDKVVIRPYTQRTQRRVTGDSESPDS